MLTLEQQIAATGLPATLDSERMVLAGLLLDPHSSFEQASAVEGWMFSTGVHRTAFEILQRMHGEGADINEITLRERALRDGLLKRDDLLAIYDVSLGLPARYDVSAAAASVREAWRLREAVRIGSSYAARAMSPFGAESDEILSAMQAEIFEVLEDQRGSGDPLVSAFTMPALEETLDLETAAEGDSYGHALLDRQTFGMQPAEVTVVGARSGVGKTCLLLQAARASCRKGTAVDIFSLEMTRKQVLRRLWSLESGVRFQKIRRKWFNATEREAIRQAAFRVAEWPLRVHDDGDLTLTQIASRARVSARKNGMRWFGVDYAQIVNAEGRDDRQRVSKVSRTLTRLAKREGVHCMLLSQLSKVEREHYSKPPSVRDLAETRQLENDAHAIILIHRGWNDESSSVANEGEFMMPKLRNESTGVIPMRFNPFTLSFE